MKKEFEKYLVLIIEIFVYLIFLFLFRLIKLPTIIIIFLSTFILAILFKIYKDYIQFGSKIFKLKVDFKFNELELISFDIEKIDTYQKIIIKDNKIIVMNKAGVFEFILFNKKGFLKGNIKDKVWYLDEEKIDNPFTIKNKFKHNYFIINGSCLFQTDVKLVTKSNIYHEIVRCLNNEVYDNKKIDEVYEVLYGNN